MQTATKVGISVALIGLLALVLACGTTVLAVQQRALDPPRLHLRLGSYRVISAPVLVSSSPPRHAYSVWLFASTYPPRGLLSERGQQLFSLPLGH